MANTGPLIDTTRPGLGRHPSPAQIAARAELIRAEVPREMVGPSWGWAVPVVSDTADAL